MKGDESRKQNSLRGKPPKLEITQGGSWGWGQFSTLNCLNPWILRIRSNFSHCIILL